MQLKKNILYIILYPFSILYGIIIFFRNWLFDQDIVSSTGFDVSSISIGNIAVGGTGKTPHTEFLLSIFQDKYKTAVLSRGYKRKTKGFILADSHSTSRTIGDEPYQMFLKFPKAIVAVDEKRVRGVKKLLGIYPDIDLVLLDDAFQHRQIRSGLSIVLTDYNQLYTRDTLIPAGRLREPKSESKRADIVVVTKCPCDIKPIDVRLIKTELDLQAYQTIFFSCTQYQQIKPVFPASTDVIVTLEDVKLRKISILLVAGIVSPQAIAHHLSSYTENIKSMFFSDHHAFQFSDFQKVNKMLEAFNTLEKILLVTEKDAARIISDPLYPEALKPITYALPIKMKILNNQEDHFIKKVNDYVVENSRNR